MTPDDTDPTEPAIPPTDEELHCVDCGHSFLHTAAEKTFFARMGYTNRPKRCVPCRRVRKEERGGGAALSPTGGEAGSAGHPDDEHYDIVCSACGKSDRVPFAPTPGREVFCHACHLARVKKGREGGKPRGGKRDGCPARK
jgi:CxxC-x17-CxxC domain-containing protein